MDAQRFNKATFDVIKRWFDIIGEKVQEYIYELQNIWNMDESGFGIKKSQSSKVLVPIGY